MVINAKKPGYPCWLSNESTWFKGKCMLFYSCFGYCRRLAYELSAYKVLMICPKLIAACKIHGKSPSRRPDGLTTLDWFTVHEATLSAYIRKSAYMRSHVGCGRVHQTLLLHVPQIFQRCKSDANKQDFRIKLNSTYQAWSTPKIMEILTKVFCISGPNLVILTWTGDALLCGQAQNGVNFYFEVKFDLESNSQSPPKSIGIITKVFYTLESNSQSPPKSIGIITKVFYKWVIVRTSKWLPYTRTDGRTYTQTDAGNDNTRMPKLASGKNWPRVENYKFINQIVLDAVCTRFTQKQQINKHQLNVSELPKLPTT